jgi:hypothetical protein
MFFLSGVVLARDPGPQPSQFVQGNVKLLAELIALFRNGHAFCLCTQQPTVGTAGNRRHHVQIA